MRISMPSPNLANELNVLKGWKRRWDGSFMFDERRSSTEREGGAIINSAFRTYEVEVLNFNSGSGKVQAEVRNGIASIEVMPTGRTEIVLKKIGTEVYVAGENVSFKLKRERR